MELRNAHALVTGGSRGIGRYIARALVGKGARVTVTARSEEALEQTRQLLDPERVAAVAGDVALEKDRQHVVKLAEQAHGPVDVLVNNAGIELVLPFAKMDRAEIERVIAVNLAAPIQLTRLVVPGMLERSRGHVVNISSISGKFAPPFHTIYASTKHGLVGFTLSLRSELRRSGVSASVVAPGYVLGAGIFAEQRSYRKAPKLSGAYTTPKEVARAVVRAVEDDVPDIIVAKPLAKLADVLLAVSPRLADVAGRMSGAFVPQIEEARIRAKQKES